MTKKAAAVDTSDPGIVNEPLEKFLLRLSVNNEFRLRFSEASDQERAAILVEEFEMGDDTVEAVISKVAGRVKVRFQFSDQQGTPLTPPSTRATKATKKAVKKATKKAAKKAKAPARKKR